MAWPSTPLVVEVSLALGADLTADPSTWSWTDITAYTFDRNRESSVVITRGRSDEATQSQPAQCTVQLNNTGGRFSPRNPLGPYYPNLRRNTPLRVRVNPGSGLSTRFVGFLSDLPPRWDLSERSQWVSVTANGVLRRLGQGALELKSAPVRYIPTTSPVAYWPLEEGPLGTEGAALAGPHALRPFVGNHTSGAKISSPQWGRGNLAPWLPDVLNRTGSAGLTAIHAPVSMASTTTWTVDLMWNSGTDAASDSVDGIASAVDINPEYLGGDTGWPQLLFVPVAREIQVTFNGEAEVDLPAVTLYDGKPHHVRWTASQSGGNVTWTVWVDGISVNTGTTAGAMTLPAIRSFALTAYAQSGGQISQGHVAIWTTPPALATAVNVAFGYDGELAGVRFARLCTEESVAFDVQGEDVDAYRMGPQRVGTLLTLLRECEASSAGVLVDRRTGELGLDLNTYRENQPAALTLDYDAGRIGEPFEPIDDDQRTRNDVTVRTPEGNEGRIVDEDGTLGVTAVGRYDEGRTVSLELSYTELTSHHAGQAVNVGTVDRMRFPSITVQLRRHHDLVDEWLALDAGSRVDLTNLLNHVSYDDIPQIVEGYTEQISQKNWIGTSNCAPYLPYQVGVLEDSLTLLTAEDTTSTAWRIGSDPDFTTDAADLPVALRVDGEVVSVTAAAAVALSFAAGTPAHADNASVVCTWPSHVEGDLLVGFAAIRNTGVGSPNLPSGYTSIYAPTSMRIFGKYATSSAESNPTVTFSGGVAGATCSVVPLRLRGCQIDLISSAEQANSSAQDVATPAYGTTGDVQTLLFWWKQDDMTSAVPPTGVSNELVEATSATGDDQTLYVAYQDATADATAVAAGSSVVTGGAAAVSRSVFVTLPRGVADLTVTRSVNGVVTSHAQLADIEVDQPMNLAL